MRERLEQRLADLKNELASGQRMSADLDQKRAELQATMLRIAGAVQVLEEMLSAEPAAEREPGPAAVPRVA
jgi:uncharacterized coiled-coil protein SlyX